MSDLDKVLQHAYDRRGVFLSVAARAKSKSTARCASAQAEAYGDIISLIAKLQQPEKADV